MTAKEAFEAQEILKEFRKGLDSLSESKLIGALDLAIEALKVQDMTLYMNLPEVSAEEAVEILKRNNRIELIPSGEDTNVPNTDTISRQATITEIKNYERDSTAPIDYVKIVEQMPSVQPERTCVNCGRTVNNGGWYADGRTRCPIEEHYALPKDGYCHLWEKRNVTDDDYPERRTDERFNQQTSGD